MTFFTDNRKSSALQWMEFIPAVVLTVGIAVVSLWENPSMPAAMSAKDKLIHGCMYFLLAVVWMLPVRRRCTGRFVPYISVGIAVVLYGALMEVLQRFCTMSRSGEMADWYADALGASIGLAIIAVWQTTKHTS